MSTLQSLESLQELYADLLALSESRISNIERLGTQLAANVQDFRALLDKTTRSDQSRNSLSTGMEGRCIQTSALKLINMALGKLEIQGNGFAVNEQFIETAKKVADNLDLDELVAAEIVLESQDESESSGQTLETCSIIRFHQRRKALLESLRLIFYLSDDEGQAEGVRDWLYEFITAVIQPHGTSTYSKNFVQRCLVTMVDIKSWLQQVSAKLSTLSMPALGQQTEEVEVTAYQRVSLVKQHELLGIIVLHLVKQNRSSAADFELLLDTIRRFDRYDNILGEYNSATTFTFHFFAVTC